MSTYYIQRVSLANTLYIMQDGKRVAIVACEATEEGEAAKHYIAGLIEKAVEDAQDWHQAKLLRKLAHC